MRTHTSNNFMIKAGQSMHFRNQRGLTLVEIMVAMAIMLVVLSAVLINMASSTKAGTFQRNYSQVMENGQTALNMLTRHIRNAGYQQLIEVPVYEKPRFGQSIQGCRNTKMATTLGTIAVWGATCGDADNGNDAIALRYQGGSELLSVPDPDARGTLNLATQDCTGTNVTGNTVDRGDGTLITIIDNRFFINEQGLVGHGNGGGSSGSTAVMVSGIEQMRFWYGIADKSSYNGIDGIDVLIPQVSQYLNATQLETKYATEPADERWEHVVSIRICVVASSDVGVVPDGATYTNCDGVTQPMGSKLRRAMYTTMDVPNAGTGL